jgi:glycosyltransferase involved in cell wall biosynthesis
MLLCVVMNYANKHNLEVGALCTILMCTNRYDKYFVDAVNSCIDQSLSRFEMIIVVNGVSDRDFLAIESFCIDERIRLIKSDANYLTYNLNLGLYLAKTDYVMRMDADDICMPQRLEFQLEYMMKHDEVIVCGCNYKSVDDKNNISSTVYYPEGDAEIRSHLYFSNPFVHPGVMLRRSHVLSIGGYMGGKYAQDYDLWIRAAFESSYKFYNIQKELLLYRSVGAEARSSKYSYAAVAATQMRMFVFTLNPLWLLCAMITFIKRVVKGG